jgi:hypothetical protein
MYLQTTRPSRHGLMDVDRIKSCQPHMDSVVYYDARRRQLFGREDDLGGIKRQTNVIATFSFLTSTQITYHYYHCIHSKCLVKSSQRLSVLPCIAVRLWARRKHFS